MFLVLDFIRLSTAEQNYPIYLIYLVVMRIFYTNNGAAIIDDQDSNSIFLGISNDVRFGEWLQRFMKEARTSDGSQEVNNSFTATIYLHLTLRYVQLFNLRETKTQWKRNMTSTHSDSIETDW